MFFSLYRVIYVWGIFPWAWHFQIKPQERAKHKLFSQAGMLMKLTKRRKIESGIELFLGLVSERTG